MARQTRTTGDYAPTSQTGEEVRAFLPRPLPPEPPLRIDGEIQALLGEADRALGRLDGLVRVLPDSHLFLYSYVRKEALLSSQIEGTQSTLTELLRHEPADAPGAPLDEVVEVVNYVAAMEHGLERLAAGFPMSLRLIREMHGILMRSGRGKGQTPGEFRRSQNWIGGTRPGNAHFVPPPPGEVLACMGALERFLHEHGDMHPLLLAALAHVQFETIHPFLDGNGRVGRLLITLILCWKGVLQVPALYLSLYLKAHRQEYYAQLDRVRAEGTWEDWTVFFLEGVRDTATSAVETAQEILALFEADRARIRGLGRASGTATRVHAEMKRTVFVSIPGLVGRLGISDVTAARALENLEALGIAREITGRKRDRQWAYARYLEILNAGTDPL